MRNRACRPPSCLASATEDYELSNSRELDWLGHFSTRLETVGIFGSGAFGNCSGHSVDRFLNNLGKCNHIKKIHFAGTNLAEIIDKVGGAMTSNNFTQFFVDECHLGVPEATFLFNTFGNMVSLEELFIDGIEEVEELANLNDGAMAVCIPSLAACTGMRSLQLNHLNLSTNSCAALRGVFPQMATLLKLVLCGNSLDDDCTRILAQGLSGCKQIQTLDLSHNRISDNGLDELVERLPASVDELHLTRNDITLAQHCRLEYFNLNGCDVGDEGAAILADGLRNNQRLTEMSLGDNRITARGWNALSSTLCDESSINATYNSNHTLQDLGYYCIPEDVERMLDLNEGVNKSRGAGLLPSVVVAWLEQFAKSRPDLELSLIFEVRASDAHESHGWGGGKGKGGKIRAQQLAVFTCRDGCSHGIM
ncbi:hypothetical protein THAOC_20566 [Thalassiosira oceanica]|uniref:Uncharacterized protein n=1 Tax=Thalassiosira oceanica TaxID=159749 RepID=K0S218_THAOC|nr:hypothetical protein THAOC_20566 [Thalassiosira oceanica]|eukprot:EJK59240.1 hypothetical protein THAOC_20566 [Thalassiosira oceanica]